MSEDRFRLEAIHNAPRDAGHAMTSAMDEAVRLKHEASSVFKGKEHLPHDSAEAEKLVGRFWQLQKGEELALQTRRYKVQQREIERIEFQARRIKDMANAYDDPAQAKRAKAMLRRIERMEKVEKPDERKRRFAAAFRSESRHGRIALRVHDFHFAHGDRVLFDGADLEIDYGEPIQEII